MQALGGASTVHRSGTGSQLPQRPGDGHGQPPQQQAAHQRQGRRGAHHVEDQVVQWRHRLRQRLLRHHPPAGAGYSGKPGEHFHTLAVGQLPGTVV
ncbi:hypothetical protein D3C80_1647190 [compost metagenome]